MSLGLEERGLGQALEESGAELPGTDDTNPTTGASSSTGPHGTVQDQALPRAQNWTP